MQFVKPIVKQLASSFEITTRANDEFNSAIQKKLSKSIWSNCLSWYRFGHTGKIITQWPGTMTEYWWNMRTPIWSHYKAVGASKWLFRQRAASFVRGLGVMSFVLAIVWARRNQDVVASLYTHFINQVSFSTSPSRCILFTYALIFQVSGRLNNLPVIPWPFA